MASYTLNFQWCGNVDRLPQLSGIYFVYRAKLNRATNNATVKELIYIGQAEDIYRRHHPHDRQADFDHQLQKDEDIICYAYCEYPTGDTLSLIEKGFQTPWMLYYTDEECKYVKETPDEFQKGTYIVHEPKEKQFHVY